MDELAEALDEAAHGKVSEKTLMGFGEPVKSQAKAPRRAAPAPAGELPFPDEEANAKRPLLVAGALLLLLLGAGGAFLLAKTRQGTEDPGPVVNVDAGTPAVVAEPPPEVPPAPTVVPVTIETRPGDGATVEVDGDTEGCEPTPCTIDATVGEPLTLRATRGRSRGELELTPDTATTVQIVLVPRPIRHGAGMGSGMSSGMQGTAGMSGPRSDELKMPTIFQ